MSPIKAVAQGYGGEKIVVESKWRKKCYFEDPDVWNRSFHLVIFQPSSFPKNFPALDLWGKKSTYK